MKPQSLIKNIWGSKVARRVIAIFVDDFGSIRIKDKDVSSRLRDCGIPDSIYLRDSLASEQDLNAIFEMLCSVKDCNNNATCITPFAIMANPDFDRIRESGFQQYFREPFTTTLKRYGNGYDHAFELWRQGMEEGIFVPAFHGTEHLNVKKWLTALQNGHKSTMLGFENESICIPAFQNEEKVEGLVKACDIEKRSDLIDLEKDINEGSNLFRDIIGDEPILFTPGSGTYSPLMEDALHKSGVRFIDIPRRAKQPLGDGSFVKPFHYIGQGNNIGQRYIVRNCAFEPVRDGDAAIASCFDQIACAFIMHKPAIISSHRVNYIGHFDENNRTMNLKRLKTLLEMVTKRWPDVEFISGKMLCELYK